MYYAIKICNDKTRKLNQMIVVDLCIGGTTLNPSDYSRLLSPIAYTLLVEAVVEARVVFSLMSYFILHKGKKWEFRVTIKESYPCSGCPGFNGRIIHREYLNGRCS